MRRLLFTLACLIGCLHIAANPITVSQAQQKAGQFLNKRVAKRARASAPKANQLKMMAAGKNDSYYIFNVGDDGGFIVVSGDDATEEILGYSDTGSINPDSMPCGMHMLLDNYADQIRFLRENGITREQNQSVRKAPGKDFHLDIARLARFNQGDPYNNECPRRGIGGLWQRCVTGCVATAMAELMYYYKWPNSISNEIPAYVSTENELSVEAIPANTSINWLNIIPQYNLPGILSDEELWTKDEEADEIAKLMKCAGASVRMDYGVLESSAFDASVPFALQHYFGYSNTVRYELAKYYTNDEWIALLCKEIEERGPVYYRGSSSDGSGHAFLLEGFYEDGRFDVNFGWDGEHNGAFFLNIVKGKFEYTEDQGAIFSVAINESSTTDTPLRLMTDVFKLHDQELFERSQESGYFENIPFDVNLVNWMPLVSTNYDCTMVFDHETNSVSCQLMDDTTFPYKGSFNQNITLSGVNLDNGFYKVYFKSRETGNSDWILNDNSEHEIIEAVVCNDKLAFKTEEPVAAISLGDFIQTSEAPLRVGQPSEFSISVNNAYSSENYKGGILIKEAESNKVIHIDGVDLVGNSPGQFTFSYTPTAEGEHRLLVLDKSWETIGWLNTYAISATQSLDLLEVTSLTLRDGDIDLGLIDGTSIRGTLYIKNNDAVTKKANVIIGLTDVETQAVRTKPVSVTIAPNSTVGYSFGFGNLTDGHHYIVTASYASGTEFYHSADLLCTTAGMGETESGNEALSGYEYWFDDDINGRQWVSLSGNNAVIRASIDTHGLSGGLHRFNFRVKRSDGAYSAVTTSTFLNLKAENQSRIVYWFDDNCDNYESTTLVDTEAEQEVTLNLQDLEKFPMGFHQLNMRVATPGKSLSNVYSARILKMGSGEPTLMEYWVDGDFEHRKTVSGHASVSGENAFVYTEPFDLNSVSGGLHRIYYRARSESGLTNSAVSMTPVMVKSRYQQDYTDPRILGYSIAVDNEEPKIREFGSPRSELEMSHILDARNLSTGNHKVKAKFWNTAYAGVSVEQQFKVLAPVVPTLTLTAQEQNGVVNLKFDAVPNDLRYRTIRVDANGAKAKVDGKEGGSYPATISFNDNPAAGTYTYYVQTAYTDYLGEQHSLKSNEVTVTVAEPLTETEAIVEYGYITGRIVCDKNTPTYGVKVRFSPDNETASVSGVNFARTKIPVGTQLTLTVEGDDSHDYEPVTVTVKAGANDVTLRGTLREEYQPNNLANDLAIAAPLQLSEENERYYVKFSVKNLSHDNDWQGIIRVKAIDKVKADKQDTDLATASFEEKNLYIGESDYVKIGYNATKEVNIFLRGLKVKKDTDFYLYLESKGKWEDTDDAEEAKPLEPSSKYDVADNPVVRTILKPAGELKWKDVREDFSYAMLGVASLTPGMNGIVGDFSSYEKPMTEFAKQFTQKTDALEAGKALVAWLQDKTALEVINEWGWSQGTSGALTIFKTLKDIFCPNKSILQKFRKDMIVTTEQIGDANDVLGAFVSLYEGVTAKNSFDAVMGCANTIYTAAAFGGGAPVGSMMYAYSVVGKSLIESARAFGPIMNSRYITTRLKANKVYNGTDEGRQNTAVDFKLIVRRKALLGYKDIDFTKDNNFKQIKNISIKAALNPGQEPAEFRFTLEPMKDGVMLKTDGKGITNGKWLDDQNELKVLYMEIQWANDRTTMIPLIQNTNGVNIDIEGANIHNNLDNFEANEPVVYTVTLTTETGEDKMADEIYLGSNKNE